MALPAQAGRGRTGDGQSEAIQYCLDLGDIFGIAACKPAVLDHLRWTAAYLSCRWGSGDREPRLARVLWNDALRVCRRSSAQAGRGEAVMPAGDARQAISSIRLAAEAAYLPETQSSAVKPEALMMGPHAASPDFTSTAKLSGDPCRGSIPNLE